VRVRFTLLARSRLFWTARCRVLFAELWHGSFTRISSCSRRLHWERERERERECIKSQFTQVIRPAKRLAFTPGYFCVNQTSQNCVKLTTGDPTKSLSLFCFCRVGSNASLMFLRNSLYALYYYIYIPNNWLDITLVQSYDLQLVVLRGVGVILLTKSLKVQTQNDCNFV